MSETETRAVRKRAAAVQARLQSGETVIWTGVPRGRLFLSQRQKAAILFSLGWWLILLFTAWSMRAFAESPLLIVLGLFVAIGAAQDSWRTGKWLFGRIGEHYALTDRRVLVLDRKGGLKAEAGLLSAHQFRAVPATGVRGTILLGEDQPLFVPTQGRAVRINPEEDAPRLSDLVGHLAVLELFRTTAAAWEVQWAASSDEATTKAP